MRTLYYILGMLLAFVSEVQAGSGCYRLHLEGKPGSEVAALSQRALERRARLGIATDSLDLEVSLEYIRQIEALGFKVVARSRWLNTVVVKSNDDTLVSDATFASLSFVSKVENIVTTQWTTAPLRLKQMTDAGEEDDCTSPLKQVNAYEPLYEAGYRGAGMLVAVLDAGFTNVDQWDWLNKNVIGTRDMYTVFSGTSRIYDGDMHGSNCLSILASPLENGICGTASEALYFLVRTETDDSETQLEEDMWVAGAELADSLGADVISSSLGYFDFDTEYNSHTYDEFAQNTAFISQGAKVACQKGILVCNAAGNERNNRWKRLIFPSDVEDVLCIGGVTPDGELASFSSAGFTMPYVKPDVVGRATRCYMVNSRGGVSKSSSGTSFSTPLIAGLCTSLWSAVPALSPAQIRQVVRESASQYNAPDSLLGYGLPDFGIALAKARQLADEMGIEEVRSDASRATKGLYNLQGQRFIQKPRQGLYIEDGRLIYRR